MKKNIFRHSRFIILIVLFSSCAAAPKPDVLYVQDSVKAVNHLIQVENVSDARYLRIQKKEFLVFDMNLEIGLRKNYDLSDFEVRKKNLIEILNQSKKLGDEATEIELKRIPAKQMRALLKNVSTDVNLKDDKSYDEILIRYKKSSAEKLGLELNDLKKLKKPKELDRYVKSLQLNMEVTIKKRGRTLRQVMLFPLSPFVRAWMAYHILLTPHDATKINFDEADFYRPEISSAGISASSLNQSDVPFFNDQQLLDYYAPVISIERKSNIKYDPKADQFGKIVMEGESVLKAQPKVDIERPTVYAYAESKKIQGKPVKLLIYTIWFPERPQLNGRFDPEVGTTQGSIIRITLGKLNKPLIYENVSSCGCYYKVFPSTTIEKWAKERFKAPLSGKQFVIENKVSQKIDADVPSLVDLDSSDSHAFAFYSAGTHNVIEIRSKVPAKFKIYSEKTYQLSSYENLENLPFREGMISMFDQDGLVRLADRLESKLLAASGMFHPGTPRQRGTLMIYFDQSDFDDPNLLETYLRIPDQAFDRL